MSSGTFFPKDATFIQVDIEPEEIGRNKSVDLGIVSDIKALLREVNRIIDNNGNGAKLQKQFAAWVETMKKADADGKEQAKVCGKSLAFPFTPCGWRRR